MLDSDIECDSIFATALEQLRAAVANRQRQRIAGRVAPATYDDTSDAVVRVRAIVQSPAAYRAAHPWRDSFAVKVLVLCGAGILLAFAVGVLLNLIP